MSGRATTPLQHARGMVWGVCVAAVIALAASLAASLHGGPQLLYALFLGTAFHYLSHAPRTRAGIEFCARTVLRLGVGLLGVRVTVDQVAALGWPTVVIVVIAVASTIALGRFLAPRLGLRPSHGLLSGGSVAICGASAALAIAAVLPRERDGERFTLVVVVTVTALSTVAMVLYPLLARWLALPPAMAGLFIGGTIHDVAQVVGAGYTLGSETGDVATIVKLFRVSLLALVVFVFALAFRAEQAAQRVPDAGGHTPARQPLVPWFLGLFVALVALNSGGWIGVDIQAALGQLSRACLVLAIAALGMKTSFVQLARAGWRPFALILAETVWIALFVLAAIAWR